MSDWGITGFGAYLPRLRLARSAIAAAHKWLSPVAAAAKGERAFCNWDEDSVTMAVEAARDCLADRAPDAVATLKLASTTMPYADLSPGVIVASALGLGREVAVSNEGGSQRAGTSALLAALRSPSPSPVLVVASERPVALPASAAEAQTGAGAAAMMLGTENVIARLLGAASHAVPFVDHFRAADKSADYSWEERWVRDEGLAKLVPAAVQAALDEAQMAIGDIDRFVLASPLRAATEGVAARIGFAGTIDGGFARDIGWCGAAHPLLALAESLENANPGERILLIGFGQGVDALVLETTAAIAGAGPRRGVAGSLSERLPTDDYLRMLSFYDLIALDWGMRGERAGKAALTEQYRSAERLDSFTAGRCGACGTVQFPVLAYCVNPACAARTDGIEPVRLADKQGTVFTVTSDWLSYHPAPPLAVGFVDFEGGARLLMEIVDAPPAQIVEGEPVRMVFRIKERDRARGYNRYFWKATPVSLGDG